MKRVKGILIIFALLIGITIGINPSAPIKNSLAVAPEKIGIYTNSFGYYIYVADPIANRVLKYSTDGLFLDTVIKTISTHASGEKWELKKVVDVVTCRLTDVIGVADAITGHSYIYELNGHTHHKNGKPGNGKGELQEMWCTAMTEKEETKSQALLDRKGCKVSHWNPPPGGIKDPRDGLWVRDFGGKGTGNGQLMYPEHMCYDKKQNLWVADTGNSRVVEFDLKGNFIRNLSDNFKEPCAVGVDFLSTQGEKFYVLDRGTKKVHIYTKDLSPIRVISLANTSKPSGMTIDAENNIWVSDVNLNKMFKYSQDGRQILVVDNLINPKEVKRIIVRVYIGKYIMTINDVVKALDAPPFIQNGKTMVPLKAISEGLGAKVEYKPIRKGQITVKLGGKEVIVWIGETKGTVDGKPVTLEVPPMIKKGRTFVPVRFISEGLGCQVNWNPKDLRYSAGAVTVIYPK